MQDSNIVYTVKAVGVEAAQAKFNSLGATIQKMKFNADGTVTASGKLTSSLNAQGKATDQVANATSRASRSQLAYFGHIAKTTVQSALVNKLFLELVDVSGQAVKQVDLMNNFPATMRSMGESTADATASMQALSQYVGQVGGNLGDATSMVTRFTGATKDVKSATAIFVGLNNALIAGDSSLEEQRLSAIQFAQALERGKPDMREWLSLTQNMSFQLSLVAKEMGFVSANALGEALRSGEVSMASFTTKLTELSTGSGVIAQQALTRMQGTQFAFNVLKNTMVQSLATIINAFGRTNIVSFFTLLTGAVKVLTSWILILMNAIASLINMISRLFGGSNVFSKITGDAQGVAEGIDSGAQAASDLGDGLKDAEKDAKKLNKSLASFDKMNVLPDKESGSSKAADTGGGGAGFDAGQIGELGNLFGDIGGKIQDASKWAKILAGVIAALAGAWLFTRGVGAVGAFAKALQTAYGWAKPLGKALQVAGKFSTSLGKGLAGIGSGGAGVLGDAATFGTKIGLAVRGGLIAGWGAVTSAAGFLMRGLFVVVVGALATLGQAVAGFFIGAAAAAALPLAAVVAIGALVVAAVVGIVYLIWTNWQTIWGWITTAFTAAWTFIVGVWNTLFEIFRVPVEMLWQFWSSVFILIVAIVATALELIFKLVVGVITLIFNVLKTIALWIFDNVIKPVAEFFVALWQGIVDGVTAAWDWIFNNVLAPVAGWVFNNVITPVANFFKALWDAVSGFVGGFVARFKDILGPIVGWIKTNIIDRISGFFTGLWDGIKNGLSNMMDGLKNIFSGVANIFKTPINGIIDLINSVLKKLNDNVKVPDWVPGLGGKGVNFPMIPKLARGGVVNQATMAMIGENGSEAVVPLENNTEWLDKLANKINGGGNGQPMQITVQIGEEKIVSKVIDLINEQTWMTGRNAINV